jgi:16S rRNA (cytosine1402-N4)-methyltransferase
MFGTNNFYLKVNKSPYHIPVMLQPCIEGLAIDPDGVYLDLTFGGGGHSREILNKLKSGHLYGFDQDEDAMANAPEDERFTFVHANFRDIKRFLRLFGVDEVHGILADLGVSSHQIDEPSRGFSTRFQGDLDMRMNQSASLTAADILNGYEEAELHRILGQYGEIKNAKTLARAIVSERIEAPILTIDRFKTILDKFAPRGKEFKYYAQVFQALRITVNDEMGALRDMLEQSTELLRSKGRLVIMSYHSLEDRLVKNYINKGKFHGEVEKDFYGNLIRPLEPITRKALTASPEEIAQNNRARSAKLRIAEKV